MNALCGSILALALMLGAHQFIVADENPAKPKTTQATHTGPSNSDSLQKDRADDVQQLKGDLQRMQTLLNQMRTNLAFVQTSQTPLKHQFELEADAWQVVVEQMERRLKQMEDSKK